jgi:hypothetical protein
MKREMERFLQWFMVSCSRFAGDQLTRHLNTCSLVTLLTKKWKKLPVVILMFRPIQEIPVQLLKTSSDSFFCSQSFTWHSPFGTCSHRYVEHSRMGCTIRNTKQNIFFVGLHINSTL